MGILHFFLYLYYRKGKVMRVIDPDSPFDTLARDEMIRNLQHKFGADFVATFTVVPELLGGMRIRVGSDVWDSSVRNRLQRLQQQL